MINQSFFKPISTSTPILMQVQRQIRGYDLTATIRHEASRIHFAHQCINYRHSCLPLTPFINFLIYSFPFQLRAVVSAILLKYFFTVMKAIKPTEISPVKFTYIMLSWLVRTIGFLKVFDSPISLSAWDTTICEPWGQFWAKPVAFKLISCLHVSFERSFNKLIQPGKTSFFTTFENLNISLIPFTFHFSLSESEVCQFGLIFGRNTQKISFLSQVKLLYISHFRSHSCMAHSSLLVLFCYTCVARTDLLDWVIVQIMGVSKSVAPSRYKFAISLLV